jgi:hypothetical protein
LITAVCVGKKDGGPLIAPLPKLAIIKASKEFVTLVTAVEKLSKGLRLMLSFFKVAFELLLSVTYYCSSLILFSNRNKRDIKGDFPFLAQM